MKVLTAVGLLLGGATVAVATVALHQLWWGLLLGVLATSAALVALPPGWWSRPPYALGFAALLGVALQPKDEGDYLVPAGSAGYLLVVLALVLVVTAFASLPRPQRTAPAS